MTTAPARHAVFAELETARAMRWQRRVLLGAIAFVLLWSFPYLAGLNNPNEHVRLYMTVALADYGTFAIGRREAKPGGGFRDVGSAYDRFGYVNDKALRCDDPSAKAPDCVGTLYAAKAPGVSYLAVPAYLLTKAGYALFGETPTKTAFIYWLRLLVVILPVLLLLWGLARFLDRELRSPYVRGATLLGLGLGSMLFSYAPVFAGHALAAVFLGGSGLLLLGLDRSARPEFRSLGAGLLAAAAVMTEYPSAVGALVLFVWVLVYAARRGRGGWRAFAMFLLGTLPPAFLLGLFHHVCFGAAWHTPYTSLENVQFVKDIAPGFMGVEGPNPKAFWGSFFAPYNGLFFFAPWLLLLLPALLSAARWSSGRLRAGLLVFGAGLAVFVVSLWWGWAIFLALPLGIAVVRLRRDSGDRAPKGTALSLGVFLAYALFISSHSLWRGGWTVGPRYIVMAMPFAGLAIALAADRWMLRAPRVTATVLGGLVLSSIVIVVGAAQSSQGFPQEYANPIFEFAWPMLRDGYVFPNAGNLLGLHGLASLAPLAAVLLGAAAWLSAGRRGERARPAPLATLALAVAVLAGLGLASWQPWSAQKTKGLTWQRSIWPEMTEAPAQLERTRLEAANTQDRLSNEELAALVRLRTFAGDSSGALRLWAETVRRIRRDSAAAGPDAATDAVPDIAGKSPLPSRTSP